MKEVINNMQKQIVPGFMVETNTTMTGIGNYCTNFDGIYRIVRSKTYFNNLKEQCDYFITNGYEDRNKDKNKFYTYIRDKITYNLFKHESGLELYHIHIPEECIPTLMTIEGRLSLQEYSKKKEEEKKMACKDTCLDVVGKTYEASFRSLERRTGGEKMELFVGTKYKVIDHLSVVVLRKEGVDPDRDGNVNVYISEKNFTDMIAENRITKVEKPNPMVHVTINYMPSDGDNKWKAVYSHTDKGLKYYCAYGKTPDEALELLKAKLY